jgi:sporulation protein YlmC with PRC-barrel domain
MALMLASSLLNKEVVAKGGAEIGEVRGVVVDPQSWDVKAMRVKLKRSVLESVDLQRPFLFGTQTGNVSVDDISGVSDTVVLGKTLEELSFVEKQEGEEED